MPKEPFILLLLTFRKKKDEKGEKGQNSTIFNWVLDAKADEKIPSNRPPGWPLDHPSNLEQSQAEYPGRVVVFMSGWAAAFLTNLYDKVINKVPFLLKKFQRVYVTKLIIIWEGGSAEYSSLLESGLLHTRS